MKLISWNVNGLRACLGKGFGDFFEAADADIFCLQETKMQPGQADYPFTGYHQYWHSAVKKGYSGTAVFSKQEPLSVQYDIGVEEHTGEGRAITLEFETFYLVCVYVPNAQRGLARIDYRMAWEDAFRQYVKMLDEKKQVIICGDLNVAATEIDLKNPKTNRGKRRLFGRRARQIPKTLKSRFCGYVSLFLSRCDGRIFVVELHVPRAPEQCGMAHRLFSRFRTDERPSGRCENLKRHSGQRSLPVELDLKD